MLEYEFNPPVPRLMRTMDNFSDGLKTKGLRAAMVGAIRPVVRAMKATAPVDTGALRRAVGYRTLSMTGKAAAGIPRDQIAMLVGPVKKVSVAGKRIPQLYKVLWLEEGTAAHEIKAKNAGVLASSAQVFGRMVRHRGARPNRFLDASLRKGTSGMVAGFNDGLERFLRTAV